MGRILVSTMLVVTTLQHGLNTQSRSETASLKVSSTWSSRLTAHTCYRVSYHNNTTQRWA